MCDYLNSTSTILLTNGTANNFYDSSIEQQRKFIELLKQQPSISDLNERLDKILETKKSETKLNETLKFDIQKCVNAFCENLDENKVKLNLKLNENKQRLGVLLEELTRTKVKARTNAYKQTWYKNLVQLEEELNGREVEELDRLQGLSLDKASELKKLNEIFQEKQHEIDALKSNFEELNEECTILSENLFEVKHMNSNLKDTIENLKHEINFYKKQQTGDDYVSAAGAAEKKCCFSSNCSLNVSVDSNLGSSVNSTAATPTSASTSSLDSNIHDDTVVGLVVLEDVYYKNELLMVREDMRREYEAYMNEQLDSYEDECEADFYRQIEAHESEYERMSQVYNQEYSELSSDIDQLNNDYMENLHEFIELNDANSRLSERLVSLSETIVTFSKTNSHRSELVIMKYSLNALRKHICESKNHVERFECQLAYLKNLLFTRNVDLMLNENVLLKSITSITSVQQLRTLLLSTGNGTQQQQQQLFEVMFTQTNLFGYVQFNFNLNHKTSSISIIQKKLDTSVLEIENLDKVLDLDLSEWKLCREIYGAINLTKQTNDNQVIEFKFPKGFKLKRRKKLVLLSKSGNMSQYQTPPPPRPPISSTKSKTPSTTKKTTPSSPVITVLPSKNKDTDVYYCNAVQNWGCGLKVVTKLVNNKNMTKYVNYRTFKTIWPNL